jgi:predicted AAA+ superfamily ATPase
MTGSPREFVRSVADVVRESLDASRVVFLHGPRQAGKTTLAKRIAAELGADYETLDDRAAREFARDDPDGFVDRERMLIIDEVQRGGDDLLLAIKAVVDRDPRPGSFLLTGSTRYLTVPNLSESLAGRVDIIDLWPLSQGEIEGRSESFVDRLFARTRELRRVAPTAQTRDEVFQRVCRGGFPEVVQRSPRLRGRWYESYVRTVTQRDIGDVARVQRVDDLPALVRLLATRTSAELNVSALAGDAGMPRTTLSGYLPLLEAVFLLFRVPAWSRNVTSKRVKQPKLHFTDTGLAAHLLGQAPQSLARPTSTLAGPLLETFVAAELARQRTWSDAIVDLHHFRDRDGAEVDLVLERRDGCVAAVEIKAGRSVSQSDLRSLKLLRDRVGKEFTNGVILNCGDAVRPLGDRLTVMPISALWAS